MTIALGILANDGFVLAADRQETYPGYWKHDVSKLAVFSMADDDPWGSCFFAGAGHGHYIDACREQLMDAVDFALSPPQERPDVQFLAVLSSPIAEPRFGRIMPMLVTSENTALKRHWRCAAIGSGSLLANTLLTRFCRNKRPLDTKTAVLIAAYVISHVKSSVDGCGSYSEIVGVHNGKRFDLGKSRASALENSVRKYMDAAEPDALLAVTRGMTTNVAANRLTEAHRIYSALELRTIPDNDEP
jgi:hypothetical protein